MFRALVLCGCLGNPDEISAWADGCSPCKDLLAVKHFAQCMVPVSSQAPFGFRYDVNR